MISISPAIRLSLGLVLLTLSMLMAAQFIGLTPSDEKQQVQLRQQQAQNLALLIAGTIQHNYSALDQILANSMRNNTDITSVGVRGVRGQVMSQSRSHEKLWRKAPAKGSSPSHMRVPIFISGQPYALLEISYVSLQVNTKNFLGLSNFISLALFLAVSGFIGYWLFIKRALKHLDPSAVVPARVRNALNILSEGVLILDQRQQIVLANSTLLEKFGRTEKEMFGRNASQLNWELDPSAEERDLPWEVAINTGETRRGVRLTLAKADKPEAGKKLPAPWIFRVNAVPIQDDGGQRQGTIVSFDDVSELEQKNILLEDMLQKIGSIQAALEKKNRELGYLASRDPLTGCFNRRALYDYLNGKFEDAMQSKSQFTCIMTDIDHFKNVNDTYGHSVGDDIIKMVAKCIQDSLRDGDIVARYGGEEFCVILPRTPIDQACMVANRCREMIESQHCDGVKVTSSFGVSSLEFGALDPQALITQADEALYLSKESGRNCVNEWNPSLANKH